MDNNEILICFMCKEEIDHAKIEVKGSLLYFNCPHCNHMFKPVFIFDTDIEKIKKEKL